MAEKLKAPFPWPGGKSKVAGLIWDRLGNVDHYIEPFFGSGAVLLLRPHPPKIETINDADSYVANFWRATQQDPDAVVQWADGPVFEAFMHANHRWLVLSDDAMTFRRRMKTEHDYFDAKVAGLWVNGLCMWIGSGWCVDPDQPHDREPGGSGEKIPVLASGGGGSNSGSVGKGVHAAGQASKEIPGGSGNKRPVLGGGEGQVGHGIHAKGDEGSVAWNQLPTDGNLPMLTGDCGGHRTGPLAQGRPQLADAYDVGRGVHSNGTLGTCAARRAWLLDWFHRLRDRLRKVRTCCGDWSRICSSESTTTRLGTCGVFLDPPYGYSSGRAQNLYSQDSADVAKDVLAWCLTHGPNKDIRIALAGYDNEGHAEPLKAAGWDMVAWEARGGYGNRTEKGRANRKRERLWFSPHCLNARTLFDYQPVDPESDA